MTETNDEIVREGQKEKNKALSSRALVRGCWVGNHFVMTFSHLEKQTVSVAGAEFYLSQVNKSLQLIRNCRSTRYKNTVRL